MLRAAIGTDNYALAIPITSILLKIDVPIVSLHKEVPFNDLKVCIENVIAMCMKMPLCLLSLILWL